MKLPLPCGKPGQQGYLTLLAVLIVSAVALTTAVTLALIGADHASMSNAVGRIIQTRAAAEACAEAGLQSVALDPSYDSGGETYVNIPEIHGYCQYGVVPFTKENGDVQRIIQASGYSGLFSAKLKIAVTVGPEETYPVPVLESWEFVSGF